VGVDVFNSGKVIGKGAATKLDIESDYKVQLVIPGRNDASTLISITGPDNHAVECARARIMVCAAHGAGSGGEGLTRTHARGMPFARIFAV